MRAYAHASFNTCSSCEEQRIRRWPSGCVCCFNTCSSCEEQPAAVPSPSTHHSFNTCSSCEEQLERGGCFAHLLLVSIHAPLARSNRVCRCQSPATLFQYMLLLRGATCVKKIKEIGVEFQYMLLLRGATFITTWRRNGNTCFNTCSSCEEQLKLE